MIRAQTTIEIDDAELVAAVAEAWGAPAYDSDYHAAEHQANAAISGIPDFWEVRRSLPRSLEPDALAELDAQLTRYAAWADTQTGELSFGSAGPRPLISNIFEVGSWEAEASAAHALRADMTEFTGVHAASLEARAAVYAAEEALRKAVFAAHPRAVERVAGAAIRAFASGTVTLSATRSLVDACIEQVRERLQDDAFYAVWEELYADDLSALKTASAAWHAIPSPGEDHPTVQRLDELFWPLRDWEPRDGEDDDRMLMEE